MNKNVKIIVAVIVALIVIAGAYTFLNAPDERTVGEHISDAVDQLDEGLDDAARELEERTPAERISDEVEDATDGNNH